MRAPAWLIWSGLGTMALAAPSVAPPDDPSGTAAYRVVRWTTAEGLPQNTINDILQLPNGEMWLATFGGLARFDGSRFKVVDIAIDEGLPANRIVGLAPRGSESFLFLTQDGHLGRIEHGRAALLVPPPSDSTEMLDLVADSTGHAYARATGGGLWHTDGEHPWERVRPGAGLRIDAVARDRRGVLWGGTSTELVELGPPSAGTRIALPGPGVVIAPRVGDGLWIGQQRAVGRLLGRQVEWGAVVPPLEGDISSMAPAETDDVLWVAIPGEVSRLERQSDGSYQRTPALLGTSSTFPVRSLVQDHLRTLWVGTAGGGLLRLTRVPTRRFAIGVGAVTALADDGHSGAVIAGGCSELLHIDAAGLTHRIASLQAEGGCQIPLASVSGGVLARAGSTLFRVEMPSRAVLRITDGLPLDAGPIAVGHDGSIWVVSRQGSVAQLSPTGDRIRAVTLPVPLASATIAPDGALWVGAEGELFRVMADQVERFGAAEGVPRGQVRDILAEQNGTTWMATYGGGVGRMRGGHVARLTVADGLPDNSVSRLLLDGRGRMWISTNRGVAVIDKLAMEQAADGEAPVLMPVVLGTERGVPEANFGSPAGFIDARQRVWLGTIDGAVMIDGERLPFNASPPEVRIDEVLVEERPIPIAPVMTLPPLTSRVRLSFTAFALQYPERIRFRFRFADTDPDWVDAGATRFVDWTPPGPGRHRFLVSARNEDGVWSAAPAEVLLDVLPAWWQTTMFRAFIALALVAGGVAVVRLRIRQVERGHASRLKAIEEQRQAEVRMVSVRAQLEHVSRAALAGELAASIAHEVRQPIGAIVNNAEAGRRHMEQYLRDPAELAQLFNDIVSDAHRASEVVDGLRGLLRSRGPEAAPIDLSALVREVLPVVRRELQDNDVHVHLALADNLPPVEGFRVQLSQIVVNLVINACEALAGVSGERRVSISTAARDSRVELVVSDNGPGLSSAVAEHLFEPFVTTKPEGLGVGLAICRSMAERHGGRLVASRSPEGGLCMSLSLPAAGVQAVQS